MGDIDILHGITYSMAVRRVTASPWLVEGSLLYVMISPEMSVLWEVYVNVQDNNLQLIGYVEAKVQRLVACKKGAKGRR